MNPHKLSLFSSLMIIGLLSLAAWSCGGGGGDGQDAEQEGDVPTDGTDGDTQVDIRPDEVTQTDADAGEDAPPVDGTEGDVQVDDAAPADTAEEDAAEEEVPVPPPVDCDGVECTAAEECCLTTGPRELNCVDIGDCEGGVMECDEAADCPTDWICCHNVDGDIGATCVETCDDIIVCGDASECPETEPNCCDAMDGLFTICRENPC